MHGDRACETVEKSDDENPCIVQHQYMSSNRYMAQYLVPVHRDKEDLVIKVL